MEHISQPVPTFNKSVNKKQGAKFQDGQNSALKWIKKKKVLICDSLITDKTRFIISDF